MTATPEARQAKPAPSQTIQTTTFPAEKARIMPLVLPVLCGHRRSPRRRDRALALAPPPAQGEPARRRGHVGETWFPPRELRCERLRSRARLVEGNGRVEQVAVGDGHALDGLGEKHVLRVDLVVAVVLGDLVLVAERDRVERARELAVAAEDAAREVDLVDPRVALAGRDAVVRRVLGGDDADAVGRARRGAERAADALLQPVLVAPDPVPPAEARVDRPLVLRVLLRDRLLEDLLERDAEALQRGERLHGAHPNATTKRAVSTALTVAT